MATTASEAREQNDRRGFLRQMAGLAAGVTVMAVTGGIGVAHATSDQSGARSTPVATAGVNLVVNGGFEDIAPGRKLVGWEISA
jgi:hypothetical protein